MNRTRAMGLLAAAAMGGLLLAAGPAQAQYVADCVVTVSDPTPEPGQTITVTGSQVEPGSTVTIDFDGPNPVRLATLEADGDGNFTTEVTIPADAAPGAHQLIVDPCQTINLTVPGGGGGDGGDGDGKAGGKAGGKASGGKGSLARSGADSFPLAQAGILLILVGAGIAFTARQRRSSRSADHRSIDA